MDSHSLRKSEPIIRETSFLQLKFQRGILTATPTGPSVAEREATIISGELRDAMGALQQTIRIFVLDLSSVQMMSSMGLGMCIETRNALKRHKVKAVLYGLNPQLIDLFRLMKIERLFAIASTREELDRLTRS